MTPSQRAAWETLIPDPDLREPWMLSFSDEVTSAGPWYLAFDGDLEAATPWRWRFNSALTADQCAYLHRRGIGPFVHAAIHAARVEHDMRPTGDHDRNARWAARSYRATLIAAHPHLTREDRDLLLAAKVTLPEVDRLLRAGPLDHDALRLLAALA